LLFFSFWGGLVNPEHTSGKTGIETESHFPLKGENVMHQTEIRVTRPCSYGLGTPGRIDLNSRQGYYIFADSVQEAILKAVEKFPKEPIDVQMWGNGNEEWKRGAAIGTFGRIPD